MADNFNLRTFLTENKLTKNTQLLKEVSEYGYQELMDAVDDYCDSDSPQFSKLQTAVDDAYEAGQIDTSEFGDDPRAAYSAVELIAKESGLFDEPNRDMGWDERDDVEQGDMEEGADDKGKMARTHVAYSASVTLGDKDGRQYIQHIRASVRKGEDAEQRAAKLIQKYFEDEAEKGDPFVKGKFIKINAIGKVLNPERSTIKEPQIAENRKPIMKETKLTTKERRLVEMVQRALKEDNGYATHDGSFGGDDSEENVDYTMGRQQDPNQLANPAPELNIPEGEEMVQEKPMPKYESIDQLMKEIEHGTNEAAHKYKMEEMKRIYELLETKVTSLEEGENAEHIDQSKVKQMRKDIAALRKAEEKLRKEFEKKFTGKQKKETPKKEEAAEALQEGTFDLRKFLVENKLTKSSRIIKEQSEMSKEEFIRGLAAELKQQGFSNVSEILNDKTGMGSFNQGAWYSNTSDCMLDDDLIEEVEPIIYDYCDEKGIEVVS